jgi:hypothetical protein
VTKVTKTQITIDDNAKLRFNRRNGLALGYGGSWYQGPRIQTTGYGSNERLMTRAEAEAIITKQQTEDEQRRLARLVKVGNLSNVSIENLQAAMKLLGIEDNND